MIRVQTHRAIWNQKHLEFPESPACANSTIINPAEWIRELRVILDYFLCPQLPYTVEHKISFVLTFVMASYILILLFIYSLHSCLSSVPLTSLPFPPNPFFTVKPERYSIATYIILALNSPLTLVYKEIKPAALPLAYLINLLLSPFLLKFCSYPPPLSVPCRGQAPLTSGCSQVLVFLLECFFFLFSNSLSYVISTLPASSGPDSVLLLHFVLTIIFYCVVECPSCFLCLWR